MASIRLFRSAFGHVSVLRAASSFVTHAHPELQIVIHIDGEPGTMVVNGRQVTPAPHLAIAVNSLEPHSHVFDEGVEPGRFLAFYIHPDWLRDRLSLGPRPFRQTAIPLDAATQRDAMALREQLIGGDWPEKRAIRKVEAMIDRLFLAALSPTTSRAARVAVDFRVRRAIETMRANLSDRICFDELARSVGLSRPHFFTLFKDQTRLTPNVYWNTLRMEEALRQLETSEDSLTEVAWNLGFTSQSNFTRFFRDHTGVPPTLYRKASRTGGDFQTL